MAKSSKSTDKPTVGVASIHHKDSRTNIPTEELRDFIADEEASPKTMAFNARECSVMLRKSAFPHKAPHQPAG